MLSTPRLHALLSLGTTLVARGVTWPAYVLAVLLPGAGHVYAGYWRRGLIWAVLCVAALAFLSTGTILVERTALEPPVVTAFRLETGTFADIGLPLTVLVLSVFDLYGLAALEENVIGLARPGRW